MPGGRCRNNAPSTPISYLLTDKKATECSEGEPVDEEECATNEVKKAIGAKRWSKKNNTRWPHGCILKGKKVYWNRASPGRGHKKFQVVCKSTASAPQPAAQTTTTTTAQRTVQTGDKCCPGKPDLCDKAVTNIRLGDGTPLQCAAAAPVCRYDSVKKACPSSCNSCETTTTTTADTSTWVQKEGCTDTGSVETCQPCLNTEQCSAGHFCCPRLKQCLRITGGGCGGPWAMCEGTQRCPNQETFSDIIANCAGCQPTQGYKWAADTCGVGLVQVGGNYRVPPDHSSSETMGLIMLAPGPMERDFACCEVSVKDAPDCHGRCGETPGHDRHGFSSVHCPETVEGCQAHAP